MHETFMRQAISLAAEGVRRGDGGPFGAVVVGEHGNQVRQRLAGSRTRLNEKVLAGLERVGDGGRHLLLPLTRRSADGRDGSLE